MQAKGVVGPSEAVAFEVDHGVRVLSIPLHLDTIYDIASQSWVFLTTHRSPVPIPRLFGRLYVALWTGFIGRGHLAL